MNPIQAKELLKRHGLRPRKGLSQNFLIDPRALRVVMGAAEVSSGEEVLEIGAGLGVLTRQLARAAKRVIALEVDPRLIPILQEVVSEQPNAEIHLGDVLEVDLESLVPVGSYPVVANIPYHITSRIIRRLMETGRPPARIVLTIQQEVAERIIAEPGDMSLLALSVQAYGRPRMMGRIPALAFYPAPKVDSAVLRIDIHSRAIGSPEVVDALFVLARAGFQQRRKQLHNALSGSLSLSSDQAKALLGEAGIDPTRRAQSLKLDEWLELSECWLELPAG